MHYELLVVSNLLYEQVASLTRRLYDVATVLVALNIVSKDVEV
jgi:hypothetical protein